MFGIKFFVKINFHYFYNPYVDHYENFIKIIKTPTLILVIKET